MAETASVSQSVSDATNSAAIDDTYLNSANETLKASSETMVTGIGVNKGKELRQELYDADVLRDNLLSAMILIMKGYQKWNKTGKVEAAQKLLDVIERQGKGIIHLTIEKESARLDAILKIYEEDEMVAAFETINLTELHADLIAAQANLKAIYQQSAGLESEKATIVSPSASRNDTLTRLNKLIDYLNTMTGVDKAKYGELASKITQLIDDVNTKIKIRTSARGKTTEATTVN